MRDTPEHDAVPPAVLDAAQQAVAALQRLRALAWREAGGLGVPPATAAATLTWTPATAAAALAGTAYEQARLALADAQPLRAGHVYCFHCRSAACEHAHPPGSEQVFAGYQNTGLPRWQELPAFLLASDDTRLEDLYADPPLVLARVVSRPRLIADQLEAFGRNSLTYRIIGQLVAGFFPAAGQRCALTVQVVEDPHHVLAVQVLAPPVLLVALAEAQDHHAARLARAYEALRQCRHALDALAGPWQAARDRQQRMVVQDQLFGRLRDLSVALERTGRQARRRTAHAELRAGQDRPVAKAQEDVAGATPADFYLDRKTQSIVVTGPRGRTHVFTAEGRHLTSLALPGDLLERRKLRRRYALLEPAAARAFQVRVGAG